MILGFAHPALVVDDLERAVEFYRDMFGFTEISREGGQMTLQSTKPLD